jgi:DNA end-binding protein Ku
MAPRAYWKGYLKLSLVSCPIALYPAASSSERVSFNRINKKTGNRLKQLLVDAETGDPVEKEDIGRGYEVAKGEYIQVEDDEIEKIKIESSRTIDIESFVPRAEIDDRYMDSPYYIVPTDQVGQEAAGGDETARRAYRREQGGAFRSGQVPGQLRDRAGRAVARQAGRPRRRAEQG